MAQIAVSPIQEVSSLTPSLLDRADALLQRAESDAAVLRSIAGQEITAGVDIWSIVRVALDLPCATDGEIANVLHQRIQRARNQITFAAGCGACGPAYCGTRPQA